ncbi:MAG: hypothetical protein JO340_06090 [Acidobacteriaceae bacterium]|nr:hypothetical protein [Acidobacteriaceae bacterium]
MLRFLALASLLIPLQAEIVDRVAVAAGQQVITELQLDEELRVAAFLNRQPVQRDLPARRAAANRLIEQLLIRREMDLSNYPLPAPDQVDRFEAQVRAALGEQDFDLALGKYNLTEDVLREHLANQLTTLQFIQVRFRPELGVSPADIESYYQGELARWKSAHPGSAAPPSIDSRDSIRKTLVDQRTDEALEAWLDESRNQMAIEYVDKSLQ